MIKALIGLGNPGARYASTRHNIGFMVLDSIAQQQGSNWKSVEKAEVAEIQIDDQRIYLVKPQTFMNTSGEVLSWLQKKGVKADEILVVHDELELPFGKFAVKKGGSAKGHNGVRSIIAHGAEGSLRLRCGISRPEQREQVPEYVLQRFKESSEDLDAFIEALANAALENCSQK
jgi:PTH1 family peptidyl-tRNA hydrolase